VAGPSYAVARAGGQLYARVLDEPTAEVPLGRQLSFALFPFLVESGGFSLGVDLVDVEPREISPLCFGVADERRLRDKAALGALDTFLKEYRDSGQTQTFPEVFIWNSIARIHLENGRAEEAMKAYGKGYESVPESAIPEDQKQVWYGRLKHGRARTFAKLGRFDDAREEAKAIHKMIEEGGETAEQYLPAYHYLVGYLELEAGNAEKAVEHLKQSNPNDPFHKLLLARGLDRIGERENALKAYQDIVDSTINGLERALAYPEAKRQLKKG